MNRMLKFGMIAGAFAVMTAASAKAADISTIESYGWTPIEIGFGTPVSIPWGFDWDVFGINANVFYSDSNKAYGIEAAALACTARHHMYGIQASAAFNFVNGDMYGIEAALFNMNNADSMGIAADAFAMNRWFAGLQADFFGGMTDNRFYGLKAAGIGSAVRNDMWGVQAALACNFAGILHGLQVSVFNMTRELHGAQISLVNYTDACPSGFQIGLVNIIMQNRLKFLPIVNGYF